VSGFSRCNGYVRKWLFCSMPLMIRIVVGAATELRWRAGRFVANSSVTRRDTTITQHRNNIATSSITDIHDDTAMSVTLNTFPLDYGVQVYRLIDLFPFSWICRFRWLGWSQRCIISRYDPIQNWYGSWYCIPHPVMCIEQWGLPAVRNEEYAPVCS